MVFVHDSWRARVSRALRRGVTRSISIGRRLAPRRPHVLVMGVPSDEGNVVEIVRALLERGQPRVHWALAPSPEYLRAVGIDPARVVRLPGPGGLPTMRTFVTAACVLTSHGIYGMSTPPRRKPHVELWHGEPWKSGDHYRAHRLVGPPATRLLSSAGALAPLKAQRAGMPVDRVVVSAQPRIDQLRRPATDDELQTLGIDPSVPFVVWMPTFRRAKIPSLPMWSDTSDPDADHALASLFSARVVPALRSAGLEVVVRPHPADVEAREIGGAVIDAPRLLAAGVPLYSVLGRSAGLITDYSSSWIDYLVLDRPIGYFQPDVAAYVAESGDLPPGHDLLRAGPVIDRPGGLDELVGQLTGEGDGGRSVRAASRDALGLAVDDRAAATLLARLDAEGLLSGLRLRSSRAEAEGSPDRS